LFHSEKVGRPVRERRGLPIVEPRRRFVLLPRKETLTANDPGAAPAFICRRARDRAPFFADRAPQALQAGKNSHNDYKWRPATVNNEEDSGND
jgi:hypothetical protein